MGRSPLSLPFILTLVLSFPIQTYSAEPAEPELSKMDGELRALVRSQIDQRPLDALSQGLGVNTGPPEPIYTVFVRTAAPRRAVKALGAKVGTAAGGIMTVRATLGQLTALAARNDVTSLEMSHEVALSMDEVRPESLWGGNSRGSDIDDAHLLFGTGTNVIVGVVDSGIDWNHLDFVDDTSEGSLPYNSRILSIWDQILSATAGESPPSSFAYGVEYTQADINAELVASPPGFVRSLDLNGHGTHVAGIAAGDGSDTDGDQPAGTYKGTAPDADIVAVKSTFFDADIVDGVAHVFQVATSAGKPAVVNLSLGSQLGPHDNTNAFETILNGLTGPGRIIVVAAGNDHNDSRHAEGNVGPTVGAIDTTDFSVTDEAAETYIDIWYDGGTVPGPALYDLTITPPPAMGPPVFVPAGTTMASPIPGWFPLVSAFFDNASTNPPNGDEEIVIRLISGHASGLYSFTLTRVVGGVGDDGDYDAWVYKPFDGSTMFLTNVDESELIGEPGNAADLITVGAHWTKGTASTPWQADDGGFYTYGGPPPDSNLGGITDFSSRGPTRDTTSDPGSTKPDITAPGQGVGSSYSTDSPNPGASLLLDGRHWINQGTSMSAPVVSGAVALYLQQDPVAPPSTIKSNINNSAFTDSKTGAIPNNTYGHGKINVQGLLQLDIIDWPLY
jgi:subtilisin family serine protease